jgi:hypothetical protein
MTEYEDVLASQTRRLALAMLVTGENHSFETLAARIAARAGSTGPTAREMATRLHHVDLPRLAEAGLVVWNWAGGEVDVTDDGRELVTDGPIEPSRIALADGVADTDGSAGGEEAHADD